jgi:hypothetical protein
MTIIHTAKISADNIEIIFDVHSTKTVNLNRSVTRYNINKPFASAANIIQNHGTRNVVNPVNEVQDDVKSLQEISQIWRDLVNKAIENMFSFFVPSKSATAVLKLTGTKTEKTQEEATAVATINTQYFNFPEHVLHRALFESHMYVPKRSGYLLQFILNTMMYKHLTGSEKGCSLSYTYPFERPVIIRGRVKHSNEIGRTGSKLYPSQYYTPVVVRTTPKTKLVVLNDPTAVSYPMFAIDREIRSFLKEEIKSNIKSLNINIKYRIIQSRYYNSNAKRTTRVEERLILMNMKV